MKGYTLIEVLVTMTIFMVLASITFMQNPQGFKKIQFNTYTHELIVNMKQLQIFGSAAGDVLSERVSGAGFRFTQSDTFFNVRAATPFYDKTIIDPHSSVPMSNLQLDTGEIINNIRIAYEDGIKVDFICTQSQYVAAQIDNSFTTQCVSDTADVIAIRPNTKFNVFVADTLGSRVITSITESNTVYIQLSYAGTDSKKCLSVKDNLISDITNQSNDTYGCKPN